MPTDERKPPREVQRVRDMPAPRKSEGAAGGAAQRIFAWPYRAILAFLLWTGIRPWELTLLSLLLNIVSGALILAGSWAWAGVALIIGGTFDVMDGSVARHRGEVRRSGAFMDSVLDRVSDMILFGCLTGTWRGRARSSPRRSRSSRWWCRSRSAMCARRPRRPRSC